MSLLTILHESSPEGAGEAIYKLQPHRTMHLRGFDDRGAAAAMHSASATGFTVSGVFRDLADFAVLMLWDRDNQFEHHAMRYLPDDNFGGITLSFDLEYTGLQAIDCALYPTIAWPYLSVIYSDGSTGQIKLLDHATPAAGAYTPAWAEFELSGTPTAGDYVTIAWRGEHHTYMVYYFDTISSIVGALMDSINAFSPIMVATRTGNVLRIYYVGLNQTMENSTTGANGNRMGAYTLVSGAKTEVWIPTSKTFAGGESPTKWTISLALDAVLASPHVRQIWLTFAPVTPYGGAYIGAEWTAVFSSWSASGSALALKVAGTGSVRVGSRDSWAAYAGMWAVEAGWYHHGFARRSATPGDKVTVEYHCGSEHDLYVGTSLYSDRGKALVSLDGDAATELDCYLDAEPAVVARRLVRAGVAAGKHIVTIEVASSKNAGSSGYNVYFDFVEAAVSGDVEDAAETYTDVSAATDYDTDASYKMPPERLVWAIDKMGLHGPLNHYVGVFWWGQRELVGATYQETTVEVVGTPVFSELASLQFGEDAALEHLCLMGETGTSLALALALYVNELSAGFWASVDAELLTIHGHSPAAAYRSEVVGLPDSGGWYLSVDNQGLTVVAGDWMIDETISPAINRGTVDWHTGFFAGVAGKGWEITCSFSMELVNPPDSPPAAVWAARYLGGGAVLTATGFGTLLSTHCAFSDAVLAYQKAAYLQLAGLMDAAGLTPWLQFGECLWWFFPDASGMAYYDDYTKAAAVAALGRALASFYAPSDDPSLNSYADAQFLRGRIKAHIDAIRAYVLASYAGAKFELLWPLDVNEPVVKRLNRYVNLPSEFEAKSGSGLDRLKMEGLAYGAYDRDLTKAREAVRFPFETLAWGKADVRYVLPWFNGGCPWEREYLVAGRERIDGIVFWAWDHLGLMGWPLPLPVEGRGAAVLGG